MASKYAKIREYEDKRLYELYDNMQKNIKE